MWTVALLSTGRGVEDLSSVCFWIGRTAHLDGDRRFKPMITASSLRVRFQVAPERPRQAQAPHEHLIPADVRVRC